MLFYWRRLKNHLPLPGNVFSLDKAPFWPVHNDPRRSWFIFAYSTQNGVIVLKGNDFKKRAEHEFSKKQRMVGLVLEDFNTHEDDRREPPSYYPGWGKGIDEVKPTDILKLAASIIPCQLAGFLGSFFTIPAIPTWYQTLNKPIFTPPNWIFAPVWISLFILMGISLFMVWRRQDRPRSKAAFIFFFVQLILNIFWSAAFFGLRSPFLGLMDIILLWIAILWTILNFFKISKVAGLLLLPYLFWVSFAALLNFYLWVLNL